MRGIAAVVAIAVLATATSRTSAQSTSAEVQAAAGVQTAVLRTAQGSVGVSIAGDAAPGDTISGVVLAEPSGSSLEERQRNLGELNGLVVEWQNQSVPVSDGRYRWTIPPALRTGRVILTLRTREGRVLSQADVHIDAVPAPVLPESSGAPVFELPTDVQAGQPAVIRGPMDGAFAGKQVRVGDVEADLVAASPRRLIFRVPAGQVGEVPLRVTANNRGIAGTVRVLLVQATATKLELARGERATMTAIVTGLKNIATPVTLTLRNFSSDVVRVQAGDAQTITVAPRQVRDDGSFAMTRNLTGVRPGAFRITVTVAPPPLALFDVPRAAAVVLTAWEAATGIRIAAAARDLIQRGVLEARGALEQFLAQQQAYRGDVRDVFAALLSHYCFDLRDGKPASIAIRDPAGPGIRLVTFVQGPGRAAGVEIDAGDVRRLSFRESLTRLVQRFSGSQPVGYLFISSVPASAGITIDGQRKSEMTNRRFVTSVGEHAIIVVGPSRTCQQRVQVAAFQISVVACGP